jgi:hypothetical protein
LINIKKGKNIDNKMNTHSQYSDLIQKLKLKNPISDKISYFHRGRHIHVIKVGEYYFEEITNYHDNKKRMEAIYTVKNGIKCYMGVGGGQIEEDNIYYKNLLKENKIKMNKIVGVNNMKTPIKSAFKKCNKIYEENISDLDSINGDKNGVIIENIDMVTFDDSDFNFEEDSDTHSCTDIPSDNATIHNISPINNDTFANLFENKIKNKNGLKKGVRFGDNIIHHI